MNNTIRFLLGLILTPIILIAIGFIAALAFPSLLIFETIYYIITAIVTIAGFFFFVYYITRKEPVAKKTKHSDNYSIKSGKRK